MLVCQTGNKFQEVNVIHFLKILSKNILSEKNLAQK